MSMEPTRVCPLETALQKYGEWDAGEIQPNTLISPKLNEQLQQAITHKQHGFLTPQQEYRLMQLLNDLLAPINEAFNRAFTASTSPLPCADGFGEKDGSTLLFFRKEKSGDKLAMPGGMVDKGETTSNTAIREFHEETGYGCKLLDPHPVVVRDNTLGGPLPRISVMYHGSAVGDPVPNHEAQDFLWLNREEILGMHDNKGFASHLKMIKHAFSLEGKDIPKVALYYMGLDNPLKEDEKAEIRKKINLLRTIKPSQIVDDAITRIGMAFNAFKENFLAWKKETLSKIDGFEQSCNTIWPPAGQQLSKADLKDKIAYEKSYNWNDFARLWDFLKPWQGRLLSTNPATDDDCLQSINKIFHTKIKIREAGIVELAILPRTPEGKFAVLESDNGYRLLTTTQRYDEGFPEALYRGVYEELGVETENNSILWGLGENFDSKFHLDSLGNDIRSFLFESNISYDSDSIRTKETFEQKGVHLLTEEELKESLFSKPWDPRHASIVNHILKKKNQSARL